MSNRYRFMCGTSAAIAASLFAATAHAQDATAQIAGQEAPATTDQSSDEIVVTGTNLRGVAPVGTNVLSVGAQEIQTSGATSANDVLARVPQITSNFNRVNPSAAATGFANTSSRPNIRNIGGTGTTLILVDGHRLVGAGILEDAPDPGVIPPAVLERIEVVPDGGSSVYGSDAVGGVINLITRRRFDGVDVRGRYGFANDYYQYDLSATAGKDWGTGSLYASYNFAKNDEIFGRDRDYVQQIVRTQFCEPGYFIAGGVRYSAATRSPSATTCDNSDNAGIRPREERHSVFASLNQDLSDSLTFDMRAYYTSRRTSSPKDQLRHQGTITSANPYFDAIGAETSQTVQFSFAPVYGPYYRTTVDNDQWGVTPSLTADLGGGWQLRALGNYGRNHTLAIEPMFQATLVDVALAGTTTATALNPYDLGATNPAVLAGIRNFEQYGQSEQDLFNARLILDGSLFRLPGGDVRVAVGAEYIHQRYGAAAASIRTIGDNSPAVTKRLAVTRTIKSVFGEVNVPVFGSENGFGGMRSLVLAASGRYDDYDSFGGTFNPKLGATWKPIDSLSIRGNWGTSFNAPQLPDTIGSVDSRLQLFSGTFINFIGQQDIFRFPGQPAGTPVPNNAIFFLPAGGNPNLKPQEADTFAVGADFQPEFVPGLTISGTYYNIDFTNQITVYAPGPGDNIFAGGFAQYSVYQPTRAQIEALMPAGFQTTGGPLSPVTNLDQVYGPGSTVVPYAFYDFRRQNVGQVITDGIDFSVSYFAETGFGSVNGSVSGNYVLRKKSRGATNLPFTDDLKTGQPDLFLSASAGFRAGDFAAQATLSHIDGYTLATPAVANGLTQSKVDGFNTVDLFFSYNVKGDGMLGGLELTLGINNVFDQDPPFFNSQNGYTNGSTVGRLFQFGVSKKF